MPLAAYYFYISSDSFIPISNTFDLNNPLELLRFIFYPPSTYWFLDALMIFYLFGFIFIKNFSIKKLFLGFGIFIFFYLIFYINQKDFTILFVEQDMYFKLIFYFMIFLSGLFFASIRDKIFYQGSSDLFYLILLIGLMYGHKYLMFKGLLAEYKFIQQLLIFPILFFSLKASQAPVLFDHLLKIKFIAQFISLISAMTLELYIIHGPIRELVFVSLPPFPGNILIYLPLVFAISYFFYKLNNGFLALLQR